MEAHEPDSTRKHVVVFFINNHLNVRTSDPSAPRLKASFVYMHRHDASHQTYFWSSLFVFSNLKSIFGK